MLNHIDIIQINRENSANEQQNLLIEKDEELKRKFGRQQLIKHSQDYLDKYNKRMFEHFLVDSEEQPRYKEIYLMQNGQPDQTFKLKFHKPLTKTDLFNAIEQYWPDKNYKAIRVFSCDAVEYFDDDLFYLKNGDRLFVSKGEDFDSNRNFGEYQIIRTLGEGGFGSVSLVKNRITQEYAAIKVLKTNKMTSSNCIDMIFRQAENLKSLSHPNIVKILNCYALKNMKFVVVMQYLEGGELKDLLKKKKQFTEQQSRNFFKQLISAVSYCHRQGIIHRDLKLENILLTEDHLHIKVTDFGISGMVNRFNSELDWGTLKYMPPQILNKKQTTNSFAGDIWACGIILFYMVEGYLPFSADTSSAIKKKIIEEELQFSPTSSLSQNCRKLISGMLCKNPNHRLQMMEIQNSQWVMRGAELKTPILPNNKIASQELNQKDSMMKKKRAILRTSVQIPKRLQRQKMRLTEQLSFYRLRNRKYLKSEFKGQQIQQLRSTNININKSSTKKIPQINFLIPKKPFPNTHQRNLK